MYRRSARTILSRLPVRTAVRSPAQSFGKRWNSSHAAPASDAPWMAGSAVLFGSATAYLLMSGAAEHVDAHGTTHAKEAHAAAAEEAAEHDSEEKEETTEDKEKAPKTESEEKDDSEPSQADIKKSLNQAEGAAVPRAAMSKEQSGQGEPSSSTTDSSSSEEKPVVEAGGEEDGEGEMSQEKIQESLHQAESAAVPRASMTGEDHGEK